MDEFCPLFFFMLGSNSTGKPDKKGKMKFYLKKTSPLYQVAAV